MTWRFFVGESARLRFCADSLHFLIGAQVCSVVPTAREFLGVCAQQRDESTECLLFDASGA